MNLNERKTADLMAYINRDFMAWLEQRRADALARNERVWEEPDLKEYCKRRLGVPYESFNRWKNRSTPVSEINLLRMAIALGDTKPLEIYGFDPVPKDMWCILVRLSEADRNQINKIENILFGCQEQEEGEGELITAT